jgi:isopenicillin N synthase-like dioxygenase
MELYFVRCADLVHEILDALSIALNVPAPGLRATHAQSLFQLRLLHYPPISRGELTQGAGRARINAHSDFGTLTLLFQDKVGGLEIEDPHHAGVFRPVEPVDGCVLVNVGDLMARWSNERWRSSVHRVGLPATFKEGREEEEFGGEVMVLDRYSIPFFATADPDQIIDALPGCWDEETKPKKFEPVTAAGYVQMRMAALY